MTEWNEQLVPGGSGFVAYRLMIEGWPHQWVTDPRIVHVVSPLSRKTYPGLLFEGLRISERMVLREAWPEVAGITARIVPSDANEDTIDGFTRDARVVASLQGSLSASSAAWQTRRELATPGIYHLGTEAVYVNGAPTIDGPAIDRGWWDSEPQDHDVTERDSENAVPIYNWPPSMEGRRAYLYAYGPSDAPDSDGQIIWRGIVRRPPRMSSDGVSWEIEIAPITTAFEQNLGAGEDAEYKIRGVYHSSSCPLGISLITTFGGGVQIDPPTFRALGFFESQEAWAKHVNPLIAAWLDGTLDADGDSIPDGTGAFGNAATIETLELHYRDPDNRPSYWFELDAGHDDFPLRLYVLDALDGCVMDDSPGDPQSNFKPPYSGLQHTFAGNSAGELVPLPFSQQLDPSTLNPWSYPLPAARTLVGQPPLNSGIPNVFEYVSSGYFANDPAWPDNRVYMEKVDGLEVDDVLIVKNGDNARRMRITAIDTGARSIDVDIIGGSANGGIYISSDSVIVPMKVYADNGGWNSFIDGVIAQSHAANLGRTPWLTSRDVDTSTWAAIWSTYPFHDFWRHRSYYFLTQTTVREVLAPELMATGWMARLAADGRLDVAPMPSVSAQMSAQWSVSDDEILLPADEMVGQWPTWEAQADGLVNIAKLRLGYDPVTDDFSESGDYTVRITQSIAEHKSGDRASQTIEVRSQSVAFAQQADSRFTFNFGFAKKAEITPADVVSMVMPYLRAVSQDYAVVTIAVPFTLFPVLVGDIVEVSSQYIPDGLGNRGVTYKKAICVGRSWELDPAANAMGVLTLYFARDSGRVAAYAPTGRVTGQSSLGADLWTVEFSTGYLQNFCWAEADGGFVTRHFAVGDAVQLVEVDSLTPTIVEGSVTAVPDDTHLTLQMTGTWTPGASLWNLRFLGTGASVSPTERQAAYCWIADEDGVYLQDQYLANFPSAREFT